MLIVQKYGGATLATPEKIKQIATRIAHLKKSGKNIVAVVSAMGQTTNQLIQLANQVSKNPSLRELDMLLSVGERTSMALLTMALNDLNCPAISFTGSQAGIFTDESHINANIIDVKAHRVSEALAKNKVVILAGFQGVSPTTKEITTLGRGGSDTTAVAMASYLNADQCEILKDVDHVFSADPKLISEAKPLANLNYDQLLEMTFWGAKVLHYKSVEMAKNKNVKLYVGPADEKNHEQKLNYESAGTWISANYKSEKNIPLAVNSHAKVLQIEMAQELFFADLVKQQIGFPQILKSQKNTLFISGPAEILSAIEKNYPNKNFDLCSVSLTMTDSLTAEIKNQIIQTLKEKNIIVTDMIESSLTFTLILNTDNKAQAIQSLHGLVSQ